MSVYLKIVPCHIFCIYFEDTVDSRYLEVISRFTRFKEFNGEKKTATKASNMFKIVPRIGTCDAGFSSSKFRSSCLPFVVKQTTIIPKIQN
jgi:hypothetical protein